MAAGAVELWVIVVGNGEKEGETVVFDFFIFFSEIILYYYLLCFKVFWWIETRNHSWIRFLKIWEK